MERLQKRELSRKLAQAARISIGDAEKFVAAFFATLTDGLQKDGEVEVYGLGKFGKEGFLPCPQLADAVNKPFVNFQPVEIIADVEADEVINQKEEELKQENSENSENSGNPEIRESEDSEIRKSESPEIPEPEIPEPEIPEPEIPEPSEPQPEKKSRLLWLWLATLTVVVLIMAGYFFLQYSRQAAAEKAAQAKADSIETARLDSLRRDSIRQANIPELPCHYTLEEAKKLMPYSAYRIEGTLTTVTVEKNQTLEDIAKIHGLPYGEFIIQLHNGIESVKEGQIIKIPLLKRK